MAHSEAVLRAGLKSTDGPEGRGIIGLVNLRKNPVPEAPRSPGVPRRRARGTRAAPVVVSSALLAAVLGSGCVVSEVTHTQNGETVTETTNEVPNSGDIDPCGLDESFLRELSIDPADLLRGQGSSSSPTCTWEKGPYSEPTLYYWVEGETPANPSNELRVLDSGVTAEVFVESDVSTRYILRADDLTLNVSYSVDAPEPGQSLELTAQEGVAATIDQLLQMYGR